MVAGALLESEVVGMLADEGLRALEGEAGVVAVASGYHGPGDRGGGVFVWEDAPSANDDGTFIAYGVPYGSNVAGPGWRRQTDGGALDSAWFGALGDYDPNTATGGDYDTAALQRALDALTSNKPSGSHPFLTAMAVIGALALGAVTVMLFTGG